MQKINRSNADKNEILQFPLLTYYYYLINNTKHVSECEITSIVHSE